MTGIARWKGESPHGTRSRYVSGCRCADCRRGIADLAAERARRARIVAEAGYVRPTGPPLDGELLRAGRVHRVKRCPGAEGEPCVVAGGTHGPSTGGAREVAERFLHELDLRGFTVVRARP